MLGLSPLGAAALGAIYTFSSGVAATVAIANGSAIDLVVLKAVAAPLNSADSGGLVALSSIKAAGSATSLTMGAALGLATTKGGLTSTAPTAGGDLSFTSTATRPINLMQISLPSKRLSGIPAAPLITITPVRKIS